MRYVLLAGAIAAEIGATSLLKLSHGLTRLWPSVGSIAGYILSLLLLSFTLKYMSVSIAYAIWSGVGTAVIAGVGMALLHEPVNPLKVTGIALIVAGVVALNLGGAH